jgi:2-methylcitrate dehydratase PrpD
MAVTAIAGKMDLSCFEDAMLGNARVRALLSRVTVECDKELDHYFPQSWPGRVRMTLNDGRSVTHEVLCPKGESANPMSEREVEDKFLTLAAPVLAKRAQSVVEIVKSLERRESLPDLFAALDCRAT